MQTTDEGERPEWLTSGSVTSNGYSRTECGKYVLARMKRGLGARFMHILNPMTSQQVKEGAL